MSEDLFSFAPVHPMPGSALLSRNPISENSQIPKALQFGRIQLKLLSQYFVGVFTESGWWEFVLNRRLRKVNRRGNTRL